jgi:hypothetical protein
LFRKYRGFENGAVSVMDKGNGGQPACPGKLKKCKEEYEY